MACEVLKVGSNSVTHCCQCALLETEEGIVFSFITMKRNGSFFFVGSFSCFDRSIRLFPSSPPPSQAPGDIYLPVKRLSMGQPGLLMNGSFQCTLGNYCIFLKLLYKS